MLGVLMLLKILGTLPPHGHPMHALTHLISCAHFKVNSWKCSGFTSIHTKIQNVEAEISSSEFADSIGADVCNELSDLYGKLSNLQR